MRYRLLFNAAFLNFIGYSVYLILMFHLGLSAQSTSFSIFLRLLVVCCLLVLFLNTPKFKPDVTLYLILFFSLIYISRIFIDALKGLPYYVGTYKLLLYYLSFSLIPFLLVGYLKLTPHDYDAIRNAIFFSGYIFSILTTFFWGNYLGTVGRLSSATADTDVISPLALSYCSSVIIGVAASYWMENKISVSTKGKIIALIGLSITPFLLGSSRGSLIALFLPFLILLLTRKEKAKNKIRNILLISLFLVSIIFLSEIFGSSLIERFTNTRNDIEEGNDSASRTIMWRNAFNQFIDHPIIGDQLKLNGFNIHPHNIFFEILQTTGFLGFIPFFILIAIIFRQSLKIFRYRPQYSWLGVLFIQSFIQNMFSGSIYGASWLMMSGALIISFNHVMTNPVKTANNLSNTI